MVERYKLYSGIFFVSVWTLMFFQFISQELLPFLKGIQTYLFFFIDVIFIVMGVLTLRRRSDILILVSFLAIAITSSFIVNHENPILVINGMRSYIGLIFAIPIMRWFATGKDGDRFMRTMDRTLFVFLCAQVPCVAWQFFKYGAGDRVGGSLGDWHSGDISVLIYVTSFYLILKKWDASNYWESLRKNKIYVLLLLPSFFNETKASFIYLLFYFVLLMKVDFGMIKRTILMSPLILVLFSGLGYVYLKVTNQEADVVMSAEFFEHYFYGESLDHSLELAIAVQDEALDLEGAWGGVFDMPRFAKIIFAPKVMMMSHKSLMFGVGLGQFKGDNVLQRTPFARDNRWLLQGSKPWLFYVFVELGFVGIVWMIVTLLHILAFRDNRFRYGMNIKLYITMMFLLFFLYLDILTSVLVCIVMFYTLMRTRVLLPGEPEKDDGDEKEEDSGFPSDAPEDVAAGVGQPAVGR